MSMESMNNDRDRLKTTLMVVLTSHPGRSRAIGMGELYQAVFGRPFSSRINGTRQLRALITELRRKGAAICSVSDREGGGYYLAAPGGSELEDYCRRLRNQGMKKLVQEALLRKRTLPSLLNEIQANLADWM